MIITLITALYLLGIVDAQSAYSFLYVCGLLLIVGEVVAGGHGLIALNGLIAFFVGYAIQTENNIIFGVPIDWSVLFGLAFVESCVLVVSLALVVRYQKIKAVTGKESMIGNKATVLKWQGTTGTVRINGETWKAKADATLDLPKDEEVTVIDVEGLTLKINA